MRSTLKEGETESPSPNASLSRNAVLGILAAGCFVAGSSGFLINRVLEKQTADELHEREEERTIELIGREFNLLIDLTTMMESCGADSADDDIVKAHIEEIIRQLTALELLSAINPDEALGNIQDCLESIELNETLSAEISNLKKLLAKFLGLCTKPMSEEELQKIWRTLGTINDSVGKIESIKGSTDEITELKLLIENLKICLESYDKPKVKPSRHPSSHPRSRFYQRQQLGINSFEPINPQSQKYSALPTQQGAFHRRLMGV